MGGFYCMVEKEMLAAGKGEKWCWIRRDLFGFYGCLNGLPRLVGYSTVQQGICSQYSGSNHEFRIVLSFFFKPYPTSALSRVMCAFVPWVLSVEQCGHLWSDLAFQLSCKTVIWTYLFRLLILPLLKFVPVISETQPWKYFICILPTSAFSSIIVFTRVNS